MMAYKDYSIITLYAIFIYFFCVFLCDFFTWKKCPLFHL